VRVMIPLFVAVALAMAPALVTGVWDFEWTSFARTAHWQGDQVVTSDGERTGRGVARVVATETPTVLRLTFTSESGAGSGLIGPEGPMAFEFPTAVQVGSPPSVPHLTGGSLEPQGDPKRPNGFVVSYVEGFICRSTPAACGGVSMWERRFEGRARRR